MSDKKYRLMTMPIFYCQPQLGWSSAALVFEDSTGDGLPRKLVLKISGPSDIGYVRERLAEVEKYWEQQIAAYKPRS